jgi:dihydroorotase
VFALVLGSAAGARAEGRYDLVLKGGHVIDPKNQLDGVMDVAIKDGKIARVAADIPAALSATVLPVTGLYVTPGLVDIHVHAYAATGSPRVYTGDFSVYPDGHTLRCGVTTAVDAGSSGGRNFFDFKRRVIDRSRTRLLAFLNIVGAGMDDRPTQQVHEDMDPQLAAAVAKKFPRDIVGIKTAHYEGPEWIAVERAVEAGKLAGIPVMVDFGAFRPERPYQQLVLEKLRPGDLSTHMYGRNVPFFDAQGKLLPYLAEARRRGVKFDVGHGGGNFLWAQALPAVRLGWVPDSISTDLHNSSMVRGMKDMTNLMSKFLALDLPLADVIKMSTWNPAQEIRRPELGHLSVGAVADVAVFNLRTGNFGFLDVRNVRLRGTKKLECELTLRSGQVLWDLNGLAGADYGNSAPGRLQNPLE